MLMEQGENQVLLDELQRDLEKVDYELLRKQLEPLPG